MSIETTEHLKQLSHDEIRSVHMLWPNPLVPLGLMGGGLLILVATLVLASGNVGAVAGAALVFVVLTLGSSLLSISKVAKARKVLDSHADTHDLPRKPLLREFKKNLRQMKSL